MTLTSAWPKPRPFVVSALVAAVTVLTSACASSTMPGMNHGPTPVVSTAETDMPGMEDIPTRGGLQAAAAGLTFTPTTTSLPASNPTTFVFRIIGSDGKPFTTFAPDQTKLMHFYLIRSDLTGFQHIHPTMSGDGTWTAPVQPLQPGSYRAYAAFIATDSSGDQASLVLGDPFSVAGTASATPLPPASAIAQVDGYTLAVGGGDLMAGMTHSLTVAFTRDGKPVTDLQPYLDTYAHVTAVHEGDLAFAHLHPRGATNGDHGGPALTFEAVFTKAGNWRLFLQFQTAGTLHTAAVTLSVG